MSTKQQRSLTRSITLRRLDLAKFIDEICRSYCEACERQGVRFEVDIPDNLWVDFDSILMRDAFRKIIDNAFDAMPQGGTVSITSLVGRFGLEIEFADSGDGISDEVAHRLFEPFTTTRADQAGLGLSLVRDIASVHSATVTATDCPEGGAAFTFLFPIRSAARRAA